MRKLYYIILALFFIGIASSCSFAPLENFKNPADTGSESYQGYLVVDDPDQVVLHIDDGALIAEPTFIISKVLRAQAYHIQISTDEGFVDVVYERDNLESNVLDLVESDLPKTIDKLFWKVRAKLNDTWGSWSRVGTFYYLHSQTLYFDSQGGNTPEPAYKVITEGNTYGALAAVTRTGYMFDGWWTEPGGTGIQITSDTIVTTSKGHIVYPKWLPQYSVTFDSQGGSVSSPASKIVTFGQTYGTLPAVTRDGYLFDGWWTGENGTGTQIQSSTIVCLIEDQLLYANLIPQYTVTFDSQGGINPSPSSKMVTFKQTYGTLPTVTKNQYIFNGWWTGVGGTGTQIVSSSTVNLTSNTTLYANWYRAYQVGERGPAGGYVFYDKGDYNNRWRYLEVAPSIIKVGNNDIYHIFGYYRTTSNGPNKLVGTSTAIGAGAANTIALVNAMGNAAYAEMNGTNTTGDYAARLCVLYEVGGYDDWFLPSKGELELMYQNLHLKELGDFYNDYFYWSSSEMSPGKGWFKDFGIAYLYWNRDLMVLVRPVRSF